MAKSGVLLRFWKNRLNICNEKQALCLYWSVLVSETTLLYFWFQGSTWLPQNSFKTLAVVEIMRTSSCVVAAECTNSNFERTLLWTTTVKNAGIKWSESLRRSAHLCFSYQRILTACPSRRQLARKSGALSWLFLQIKTSMVNERSSKRVTSCKGLSRPNSFMAFRLSNASIKIVKI